MKRIATLILCIAILAGCDGSIRPDMIIMPDNKNEGTEKPEQEPEPEGIIPFTPASVSDPGAAYVWDGNVVPEITIHITKDEWNRLLNRFDEFNNNVDYFHADFTYKKGSETTFIEDGGVRLRGNTSRRRPEGSTGQLHDSDNPDWHHCHFGINFRKYHKDDEHTVHGIRKINLKWFKDDPCYVRELYCYDLFRRYGIWTSAFSTYCRLWIQIDDEKPAYFGVYNMIEPIDDEFVERREAGMFQNDKGNLWKCVYGVGGMADFKNANVNNSNLFNWDQDNGTGLDDYKVYFLPYDYDNSLGTSAIMEDAGRQDPYNWGEEGILMEKILQFDDFRQMYRNAFLELTDPSNDLFHMDASIPRIKAWHDRIRIHVYNDTGEDMKIRDNTASWSNHTEYRLLDPGPNNWFRVKTEVVNSLE